MSALLKLALLAIAVAICFAASKPCSSKHCTEELASCDIVANNLQVQNKCINGGKMYITYKKGTMSKLGKLSKLSKAYHVCCPWKKTDLSKKFLSCVTKIRSKESTCFTGKQKTYDFKVKTKGNCKALSCFKKEDAPADTGDDSGDDSGDSGDDSGDSGDDSGDSS